ncbi:hypothetical protein [Anaerosinus gibii]|uniref:Uncharacterized protein n=1 Tax=Selenobaculum gibii TaxID=3054208 RepID=A0A9Y2ETA8_9FIRM|nr:hypothetical protein [Selenobaculum gbiensis]WIW71341.1 hypothetical protein P3F81_03235 [Selenobaculum gbiensis]
MQPVKLRKNENGDCLCPLCKTVLKFSPREPVQVVDGKLKQGTEAHYICESCKMVYRPLVNTEYYQCYSE